MESPDELKEGSSRLDEQAGLISWRLMTLQRCVKTGIPGTLLLCDSGKCGTEQKFSYLDLTSKHFVSLI
jgi:hypothetical protein